MSFIQSIKKPQYEVLTFNRGKANPMHTDFIKELRQNIARLEADPSVRGVILTGNTPGYFTVGLDLKELYQYDEAQIEEFWTHWEAMVLELTCFSKPLIAAINGYSPAGGCVIAITCDHRLMAEGDKFIIGLNEVAVGITVPEYIFQLYAFWLGNRQAYQCLLQGKLMKPKEAQAMGLVDEVLPMDQLLSKAEENLQRLLVLPDNILQDSKRNMRRSLIDKLQNLPAIPRQKKLDSWFNPNARAIMKMVVDSLTK